MCGNLIKTTGAGGNMTNSIIDYYNAVRPLEDCLIKEDLAGVMAWKVHNRWTFHSHEHGCNPIQLFGSLLHKFEMDKVSRDKLSIMAGMLFTLLEGEQIVPIIRAAMICNFSSRIYPEVMKPFFDEGGPLHVSPDTLNEEDATLEGSYLRAEPSGSHMDGVAYALDKLGGWYGFDDAIMNRVIISRRPDYMATVIAHPHYRDTMAKRQFVMNREVLIHPEVLEFAIKHDKVDLSNLGYMLNCVIEKGDAQLMEAAIAQAAERVRRFKGNPPADNFKAIELYLKVHSPECPLRETALNAFMRERKALAHAEPTP